MILVSGVDGAATGHNVPHVTFRDVNGSTLVDMHLSGNVVPVDDTGVVLTWNTPTMGTGWATGPGGGGSFPPLKWRYGDADDVWVFGTFHATSTTPNAIIATGFPGINIIGALGGVGVLGGVSRFLGAEGAMPTYLNDIGQFRTQLPTGWAFAVNDSFMVNCRVPLGVLS